jgi:acyl dehydratase
MINDGLKLYVSVGDSVRFSKTVSESDVYSFAGVTGDFAPYHINEQYMRGTQFGHRIAHGALLVGFMSTCSTMMSDLATARGAQGVSLSLGYDRIRFLLPVFFGETLTLDYTVSAVDEAGARARAAITVKNQNQALVAVAEHILKWVIP